MEAAAAVPAEEFVYDSPPDFAGFQDLTPGTYLNLLTDWVSITVKKCIEQNNEHVGVIFQQASAQVQETRAAALQLKADADFQVFLFGFFNRGQDFANAGGV